MKSETLYISKIDKTIIKLGLYFPEYKLIEFRQVMPYLKYDYTMSYFELKTYYRPLTKIEEALWLT